MTTINILQSYYKDSQKKNLDASFIPYDASQNPDPNLREFPLYYSLFKNGIHREHGYTGIFSHKFTVKSKIAGERFISFVKNNPGYDIYFINPYPQLSYLSYNIWEQGEYFHQNIKKLTNQLFRACGHTFTTNTHGRDTRKTLLYANFWIGNKKFWDHFIPFLIQLHDTALLYKDISGKNPYLEETPHITPAPMYPFIFERLFTSFIKNQSEFSFLSYQHTESEIRKCCNTPAELAVYGRMHKIIDQWDNKKRYSAEHKAIFQAFLGSTAEYEMLLREKDEHPFI